MDLNGFDHFLFFIVGVLIPALSLLSAKSQEDVPDPQLPEKKHLYFSNGLMLWIGALLVITNWNLSGREWTRLGWQMPKIDDVIIYLCVILLIIYVMDSIAGILKAKNGSEDMGQHMEKILPVDWTEYSQFTFLAISAGICEEFIFRGFLVNYFFELMSGSQFAGYLAVLIPALIFSISHLYQGWLNVIKIMSLALLFGAIFLLSESLLLVIIIHVLVDLISGALVVILSKQQAKKHLKQ